MTHTILLWSLNSLEVLEETLVKYNIYKHIQEYSNIAYNRQNMFVKLTTVIALLEANLVNCLSIKTISWSSDGPHSPNASSYPSLSFDESPSSFLLFLSMPAMSSDGVHIPNASSYPSFSFDESPSSFLLVLSFFAIKESYHRSNIIINPINLLKV